MKVKLYEVPRNSTIEAKLKLPKSGSSPALLKFHHLDGAYSYCTIIKPRRFEGEVVHLSAVTLLTSIGENQYRLED